MANCLNFLLSSTALATSRIKMPKNIPIKNEKARLLASDEYKDQKMENMQLLAMLAQANADIDYQTFMELANVAISAGDTTAIKYMGMMAGKQNASFANDIIHQINIAEQNKPLSQFADSAKQFLVDGDISLNLMAHMKLYEEE